jgi:hypothetical protein
MELNEGTVSIYIVKNPAKHRQKGLGLALGTDLMKISSKQKQQQTQQQEKNFITDYIGDPYLFKGHKINIRQYVLLVCINGRLRAYTHDNSKVFYAKRPFVEPYISEEDEVNWNNNNILMEKQTDALFTTGYLDDSFYDDKPMTLTELWDIFKEQKIDYTSLLKSMHLRLALAISSINSNTSVADST